MNTVYFYSHHHLSKIPNYILPRQKNAKALRSPSNIAFEAKLAMIETPMTANEVDNEATINLVSAIE